MGTSSKKLTKKLSSSDKSHTITVEKGISVQSFFAHDTDSLQATGKKSGKNFIEVEMIDLTPQTLNLDFFEDEFNSN